MYRRVLLIVVAAVFCAGASCSVSCDGVPLPGPQVGIELDRAACTMRITETTDGASATATAEVTSPAGSPVALGEGQSIQVNAQAMAPADDAGQYTVAIPAAAGYTVRVTEPTRGVSETSQDAPADFQIAQPLEGGSASLSGFTVAWSNPDPALTVTVRLDQTLFGEARQKVAGPTADTGSRSFGAADLVDFQQGASLAITVTRAARREGIHGFAAGELLVERARFVRATPQP